MLKSTFLHIPGIGEQTETKLWNEGIKDWENAINKEIECMSDNRCEKLAKYAHASLKAIEEDNTGFFTNQLASKHHWRSYDEFQHKTCYLDIETTGLDTDRHDITVIGLYDGEESHIYVQGKNLSDFQNAIQQYNHVVTFNGARFDLPFIENNLDIEFTQLHTDLMYLLRRLNYTGGLKAIEPQFGIEREDDVEDVDGAEAVRLWHAYQNGDENALQRLITYNKEDIANLQVIMEQAFDEMKQQLPV